MRPLGNVEIKHKDHAFLGIAKVHQSILRIESDPVTTNKGEIFCHDLNPKIRIESIKITDFTCQLCIHTATPIPAVPIDLPVIEPRKWLIRLGINYFLKLGCFLNR